MTDPNQSPTPAGLMLIDKPEGPTSMDICRRVRRGFVAAGAPKRIKVGHGGTLDPLASGLVVVLVGKATKLCDQVMAGEKSYVAGVDLAHVSNTDDREGQKQPVTGAPPTSAEIEAALSEFTGEIMQRPPAFSAVWIDGERAYGLARKAEDREEIERKILPRPVMIHDLRVVSYAWPILTLEIRCGKGTYIRSLARDLGTHLGTGGMLESLRRTRVEPFDIEGATHLDDVPGRLTQDDLMPPPSPDPPVGPADPP